MTVSSTTAPLPVNAVHRGSAPHEPEGKAAGSTERDPRQKLLHQAAEIEERARAAAEQGDLAAAARLILQALDCERRAVGLGPQVLQLIKPRV
jgi:hypothetical protein